MKKIPRLGEQELEILKHIQQGEWISVREATNHFEKEKKWARTTVLTVMERLRKKGFLARSQKEGVYKYSAKIQSDAVLSSKITEFVEKTLGGSVSPLINYFLSSGSLSKNELEQLKKMALKIEAEKSIDE